MTVGPEQLLALLIGTNGLGIESLPGLVTRQYRAAERDLDLRRRRGRTRDDQEPDHRGTGGGRRVDRVGGVTARIVLFGATGYTGARTAEALVARGARPVLAGRDRSRLAALAERLGGPGTPRAGRGQPAPVRGPLDPGGGLGTPGWPVLSPGGG